MRAEKSRAIRGVVFDLDGLMFNTEELFHQAGDELLSRRGHRMTPRLLSLMMGRRARESFALLIAELELLETVEVLLAESETIFKAMLETHLAPMPGLFELLEELETRGLPKAVATSSSRDYLEGILERFELLERFHFTLTAEDVTHGKPHPEIYLTAAERMKLNPAELVVFEDSETGSRAAASAGTYVIAVPHDFSRDHDFAHVHHVAQGLHDPFIRQVLDGEVQAEDRG
jgi:HAD superfamily hydrolase (TIGR01509 family)